jgi:uncharacterized protein with PIN domain
LVESIGVPHTEVELILANGQAQSFSYLVQAGDRIAVYPAFTTVRLNKAVALRPPPPQPVRFLLDNHLGRLARYLRLLGFDTLYFNNAYDDAQLAELAQKKDCILLSRDRGLLKRGQVIHGYCLRSKDPRQQATDVLHRYQLTAQIKPWRRCLRCNGVLQPVAKEQILHRLEPKTKRYYTDFQICSDCQQIYWRGSHFQKLESFVAQMRQLDSQNPG